MSQTTEISERIRCTLPPLCEFDLATVRDVVPLTYLFKDFFAESDYAQKGITYSPNKAAMWLKRVIETGSFPHVVARVGDKIIGVVSWSKDDSFCEEPVAVLHTIFVRPEYRRSPIGRMLISFMIDIAENEGAAAISVPISSGMKETKSLQNMLGKCGFTHAGAIMTKVI